MTLILYVQHLQRQGSDDDGWRVDTDTSQAKQEGRRRHGMRIKGMKRGGEVEESVTSCFDTVRCEVLTA